ncbi:MAG TPA: transcription elongation factor GreA [Candidatus Omnitrophica bacterium]|nr:transcription elongation factor GreA [Candidatus Omnitrophota bacterium]
MSLGDIYLTREGYEKLMNDLEYFKTKKRREISKAVAEARAHGDISENAEYDAAKEALAQNEAKVVELEDTLARARILDENMPKDEILIGAKVKLKDLDTEEDFEYMLVSAEESDYDAGKISIISPVGSALLNHRVGDEVEIEIPAGTLKYKVLVISR